MIVFLLAPICDQYSYFIGSVDVNLHSRTGISCIVVLVCV